MLLADRDLERDLCEFQLEEPVVVDGCLVVDEVEHEGFTDRVQRLSLDQHVHHERRVENDLGGEDERSVFVGVDVSGKRRPSGGTYFVRAERPERSVSAFEGTRLAAAFVTNRPVIADRVVTRPIAADAAVFRCATVPDGATMRDFFALLLSRAAMNPV